MSESSEYSVYSIAAEEPRVKGTKYLLVFTNRRLIAAFESGGLTRLATTGVARTAYDNAKMQQMKEKTLDELLSDKRSIVNAAQNSNNSGQRRKSNRNAAESIKTEAQARSCRNTHAST